MPDQSQPAQEVTPEKFDVIHYRYEAKLDRYRRVPTDKGTEKRGTYAHATISGRIYPHPYSHPLAVAIAQQELQPLVDKGWRIQSLIVTNGGA